MTAAAQVPRSAVFCSARLEAVFDGCFVGPENTRLLGGALEPLYVPAGEPEGGVVARHHRLFYREDFFASALHEAAHWCIAGPERRLLRDFGYWYAPDGRSPGQQAAFQAVEVAPQALEWWFARACGYPFRVSLDNLEAGEAARRSEAAFKDAVTARANTLRERGLAPRARRFFTALAGAFATGARAADQYFYRDELA
ncbi:elongation factor P hydroxylase [Parahaliea mediterranea]|uniref:Elongation factor P hydroxylase n=1 Tax=Parahaliea mediterranea TaxID=651086 RepID=A0A939IP74_9GAMM|nr:elongation factor P hydroxylase [Parahaliea mediterranea]MBN7798858.1 elongation factor P hydroxylase [Parahaliea mediterranea]